MNIVTRLNLLASFLIYYSNIICRGSKGAFQALIMGSTLEKGTLTLAHLFPKQRVPV